VNKPRISHSILINTCSFNWGIELWVYLASFSCNIFGLMRTLTIVFFLIYIPVFSEYQMKCDIMQLITSPDILVNGNLQSWCGIPWWQFCSALASSWLPIVGSFYKRNSFDRLWLNYSISRQNSQDLFYRLHLRMCP
jgi:hypothetical protein